MTAPQANFQGNTVQNPGSGVIIGSESSEWLVFNSNSKAAMTTYDDPYDATRGQLPFGSYSTAAADANAANVIPQAVPDGVSFLDLYHIYAGTADPSQALIVRVYGWKANKNAGSQRGEKSKLPVDLDATNFDRRNGYWVALDDAAASYTHVITFTNTYATRSALTTDTTKQFRISPRQSVFLAGCEWVIVTVAQAANQTGVGQVMGRFVS